jgi:hypothetical protein
MGKEPFDVVTLFDEQKWQRMKRNHKYGWGYNSDYIETGNSYQDLMRMGTLTNVGLWGNNWVPEYGGEGIHDDETDEWIERPCRGYRQAVDHLCIEGVLRPNKEVYDMMLPAPLHEKRRQFPDWVRLYAND